MSLTIHQLYPSRYYASYDTTASQPTPVTGWYDVWGMASVSNVPPSTSMIPISDSDWGNTSTFRIPTGKGVKDGVIVDYTPPVTAETIKQQASNELTWINQQASLASAMGETFTVDMKSYVKQIQAIASGSESTTTLPTRPSDIMA